MCGRTRTCLRQCSTLATQVSSTKPTLAQALAQMDIAGGLKIRLGNNWGMAHGRFILQCMKYIRHKVNGFRIQGRRVVASIDMYIEKQQTVMLSDR